MRPLLVLLLAMLVAAPAFGATRTAKVVKVVDGDTVVLKVGSKSKRVNLGGIDAPEGGACFAAQAKAGLQSLLRRGAKVKLRGSEIRKGSKSINAAMVSRGLARAVGGKYSFEQQVAQNAGRGLHAAGACTQTPGGGTTPGGTTPTNNRVTDPAQIKAKFNGTIWFWERFDQAGTGGTTDRWRLDLCTDGTFKLRRSQTITDGGSNHFTEIVQDFGKPWSTSGGFIDGDDMETTIKGTIAERDDHTAENGHQQSQPNEPIDIKISLVAKTVTINGTPGINGAMSNQSADGFLSGADCSFEQ